MSIRNQFKATPTKKMKAVAQTEDSAIFSGGDNSGDYHKIKDGLNKFRLFPAHPGEENFYKMRSCVWVTILDNDDKEARRTVSNARIHGGYPFDIVEKYNEMLRNFLDPSDPDDQAKLKVLADFKQNMEFQNSWIAYANKMVKDQPNEFGKWEFKKSVRDKLNQESIIEDEDEAMETDPFTDPDTGIPVLLKYNSKAKSAKDYYTLTLSKNAAPLTDKELDDFAKVTPLSQLSIFKYTNKDFEWALEGLQFYDEKHEFGFFETDEFQEVINEFKSLMDTSSDDEEEDDKPKKKQSSNKKPVRKVTKDDEEELEDEEDDDDVPFEEDDEEEEEEVKPKKTSSKKPISKKKPVVEEEDDEEEEVEDEEDEEEEQKPVKKSTTAKSSKNSVPTKTAGKVANLEELKAKLQSKLKK